MTPKELPPVVDPKTGCWVWPGSTSKGYGVVRWEGRVQKVHRLVFEAIYGWAPEAVLHRCDNPPCMNPRHLVGGTLDDNNQDALRKKRGRWRVGQGERNGNARLTDQQVEEIRALYASGEWRQVDLASRFNCSQTSISDVVRRRTRNNGSGVKEVRQV